MKKIFSLALVVILLPVALLANGFKHGSHEFGNPAVKQYVKTHIMPVLQKKRALLENELTAPEKAEIAECRSTLKQLREEHQTSGKEQTNIQQTQNNGKHNQVKQIMERLDAIAAKHSNTLDDMHKELEPSRKQWKEDIEKLLPQRTKSVSADGNHQGSRYHQIPSLALNHHFARAHFLLLPVSSTNSTGELKEDFAGQTTASNNNAGNEFQVLPNPASNEIVTGNAQLPQQNQMLLTDMQGKTVLSVQNIQPAQHLDITQVPAGTYIVQFTGGGQVSNSKIIITH